MNRNSNPNNFAEDFENSVFNINELRFGKNRCKRQICLQSENGPCPLIAIINILLLRGDIEIESLEWISGKDMVNSVANHLISKCSSTELHRALVSLENLKSGLTINVKFNGVDQFDDPKRELEIFRLLDINLYHAWLMESPSAQQTDRGIELDTSGIRQLSYDEATTLILTPRDQQTNNHINNTTFDYLKEFLSIAGIITYSGLITLYAAMKPNELAVLFHDNHFSVVYCRRYCVNNDDEATTDEKTQLYLLITDIGYYIDSSVGRLATGSSAEYSVQNTGDVASIGNSAIKWQALTSVTGDTEFVDDMFNLVDIPSIDNHSVDNANIQQSNSAGTDDVNLNADLLMALQMQQEEDEQFQQEHQAPQRNNRSPESAPATPVTPAPQQQPIASQASNNFSCIIL